MRARISKRFPRRAETAGAISATIAAEPICVLRNGAANGDSIRSNGGGADETETALVVPDTRIPSGMAHAAGRFAVRVLQSSPHLFSIRAFNSTRMGRLQDMSETESPFVAKVCGRGKVTIPKHIRALLQIADGDYVECNVRGKVERKEE